MRARWIVVFAAFSGVARGQEVPDPEVAEVAETAPRVSAALGRAVAERFIACAGTEGDAITEDDRSLIGDSVAPLADAVARGLGATDCAGSEAEAQCVDRVRAADCDALAHAMQDAPSSMSGGAPPPWAESYARTLVERISTCYAAERDGAVADDDRAALAGLRRSLASTVGLLVASGRCRIDENALSACVVSAGAIACDALATQLDGELSSIATSVTPDCARFLVCGDASDEDGGADD